MPTPDLSALVAEATARGRRLRRKRDPAATPVGPRRALNRKHRDGCPPPSKYRGVYPTRWGTWQAKVRVAGVLRQAGCHPAEDAAARAYDALARRLLGDKAVLNFPQESEA